MAARPGAANLGPWRHLLLDTMATLPIASHSSFSWIRRYGITLALVVGYLAMTLLVIEQGRVIDSQQKLIRLLFSDSTELTALKVRQYQEKHQH